MSFSSFPSGKLFIVSAPSGVGKTTIIKTVRPRWPGLHFSVSCTTRSPRPGEVPGEDYHFISREEFTQGINEGRFLEWAEVHGEFYGTDGKWISQWLQAGDDVLLDIDVQGARQVLCVHPTAHTIFILPPSLDTLRKRLENRGTESPEKVEKRLAAARQELLEAPWYDYIIVNDILEEAVADMDAVLRACRCHRTVQAHRIRSFLQSCDN